VKLSTPTKHFVKVVGRAGRSSRQNLRRHPRTIFNKILGWHQCKEFNHYAAPYDNPRAAVN